jgi:hypothetical protein
MSEHFICTGECKGLAVTEGVCNDKKCPRSGKDLTPCHCIDGTHFGAQEPPLDELEEEE